MTRQDSKTLTPLSPRQATFDIRLLAVLLKCTRLQKRVRKYDDVSLIEAAIAAALCGSGVTLLNNSPTGRAGDFWRHSWGASPRAWTSWPQSTDSSGETRPHTALWTMSMICGFVVGSPRCSPCSMRACFWTLMESHWSRSCSCAAGCSRAGHHSVAVQRDIHGQLRQRGSESPLRRARVE